MSKIHPKVRALVKPQKSILDGLKFFLQNDFILFYWAFLFLAPIIYLYFTKYNMLLIGSFVCIWCAVFIGYLLMNYKIIIDTDRVVFSKSAIVTFFLVVLISFLYSTITKYYAFFVPARDAAIFNSMMQEILLGKFGYSTVVGFYHFGTHQNYVLLLLLPLYFLFPSQVCLQVIGAVVVWGAGIMLYKILRCYVNQLLAILAVVVFYASPSNHFYFFRPELFLPLGIFLIYYTYIKNMNWKYVTLATLFFLSIKEDATLYMPGFILLFALRKDYKLALSLFVITCTIVFINLEVVQPYFVHKSHQAEASTLTMWAQWGNSNKEIAINIITHPYKVFALLFDNTSGFWYLYEYWLFLPLFSLSTLSISFLPMMLFTTSDPGKHALIEYYPNALAGVALLGMILFAYKIVTVFPKYKKLIYAALVFILLVHNVLYVRITDLMNLDYNNMPSEEQQEIFATCPIHQGRWQEFFNINMQNVNDFNSMYDVLKNQYKDKNICFQNQLYPHASSLDFSRIKVFNGDLNQADCIDVFAIIGDQWPKGREENYQEINQMFQQGLVCQKFGNFGFCDNLKY